MNPIYNEGKGFNNRETLNNYFFSLNYGSVAQSGRAHGFYKDRDLCPSKRQSLFEVTMVSRVQIPSGPF